MYVPAGLLWFDSDIKSSGLYSLSTFKQNVNYPEKKIYVFGMTVTIGK